MISKNENKKIPYSMPEYAERNFSIPFELRKLKQWGIAKAIWNEVKGKYEKFPFEADAITPAKSNDPKTWTYFHNVRNADLLSYFFNGKYTGMDFDHVIHNGKIEDWVLDDFIKSIGSYAEISVSGNGAHIIVKGPKPRGLGSKISLKNGHSIEIYDSGRFFLLTGKVYEDYREIKPLDQESFFKDYIKPVFEGPDLPLKIGDGLKDVEGIVRRLTPYWAQGNNHLHFLMLRLSGYVASCGGTENDLQFIISELVKRTNNGQYRPHVVANAFRNSRERLEYNLKVPKEQRLRVSGRNSLLEIMEVIANEQRRIPGKSGRLAQTVRNQGDPLKIKKMIGL